MKFVYLIFSQIIVERCKIWEKELLHLENIRKKRIFAADDVGGTPIMFDTKLVPRVALVELEESKDIAGKIKKSIEFALYNQIPIKIQFNGPVDQPGRSPRWHRGDYC